MHGTINIKCQYYGLCCYVSVTLAFFSFDRTDVFIYSFKIPLNSETLCYFFIGFCVCVNKL